MEGKRHTLCMRFQSGQCKDPSSCRYLHRCAIPNADGTACGGNHPASQHVSTPHQETRFDDLRNIVEEVPAVPLCVPAQPSGSSGATSSLQAAGASVSQAATATSEGTLDFTTCLELLVEAFSIPFASGINHDSAIDASEAYVNLGAYLSGFRQRLPLWYFQRTEQFSCILRFLNAVMQLQFAAATWTCFASTAYRRGKRS